jgi:phospholipase C
MPTPSPTPTPTQEQPTHVVVVIQENRTLDNLFNGFKGADTVRSGMRGTTNVALAAVPMRTKFDLCHKHTCFVQDFDGGKVDGFDTNLGCAPQCVGGQTAYSYVQPRFTATYWQIASQFALADETFEGLQGPSYPAHQYLIAGQSGRPRSISENTGNLGGGCPQAKGVVALTIDTSQPYPSPEGYPIHPCMDYRTIFDEFDSAGVSWRYYTPKVNFLWTAPEGVSHLAFGPDAAKIVTPETAFLSDAVAHQLSQVSYVVPRQANSDHPKMTTNFGGPNWVGTIVNTIESDPYYSGNTVIFIVWDDWGGWYDHEPPATNDSYEYGFRVPLLVVNPYVVRAVSHTKRNFVSILTFMERLYGLPSLGTEDAQTDDLFSMFAFGGQNRWRHSVRPAFEPVFTNGKTWRDYVGLGADLQPPESEPGDE